MGCTSSTDATGGDGANTANATQNHPKAPRKRSAVAKAHDPPAQPEDGPKTRRGSRDGGPVAADDDNDDDVSRDAHWKLWCRDSASSSTHDPPDPPPSMPPHVPDDAMREDSPLSNNRRIPPQPPTPDPGQPPGAPPTVYLLPLWTPPTLVLDPRQPPGAPPTA